MTTDSKTEGDGMTERAEGLSAFEAWWRSTTDYPWNTAERDAAESAWEYAMNTRQPAIDQKPDFTKLFNDARATSEYWVAKVEELEGVISDQSEEVERLREYVQRDIDCEEKDCPDVGCVDCPNFNTYKRARAARGTHGLG
jgi:hypothetical protein